MLPNAELRLAEASLDGEFSADDLDTRRFRLQIDLQFGFAA